jgi:hypothetical protein
MKFYHATSEDLWTDIQKEGVLFGRRYIVDDVTRKPIKEVSRCTYLALKQEDAEEFGEVVLEVEYNPFNTRGRIKRDKRNRPLNNYSPDSWQLRVYEPISLENVKRIE